MTTKPARLLAPDVLLGYERRAEVNTMPTAKLPEILELRAIIRAMASHIRAMDAYLPVIAEELPMD